DEPEAEKPLSALGQFINRLSATSAEPRAVLRGLKASLLSPKARASQREFPVIFRIDTLNAAPLTCIWLISVPANDATGAVRAGCHGNFPPSLARRSMFGVFSKRTTLVIGATCMMPSMTE